MATHSSILAWTVPWTEEPGGLSPWGRKQLDNTEWLTNTHTHTHTPYLVLWLDNTEWLTHTHTIPSVVVGQYWVTKTHTRTHTHTHTHTHT